MPDDIDYMVIELTFNLIENALFNPNLFITLFFILIH